MEGESPGSEAGCGVPQLPLRLPPPPPSCARMGVGVAVRALGLQRSHGAQRGPLFSLPSISPSPPESSVLCFLLEVLAEAEGLKRGWGEGLSDAQGCGGGDPLL